MGTLKIATYKNLVTVPVKENNEAFVPVDRFDNTILQGTWYTKSPEGTTVDGFDGKIVVRETVARKLAMSNATLKSYNSEFTLYICYGYRSLETQTKLFSEEYAKCPIKDTKKHREAVHKMIAFPDVAGHPTGGAVDLTIHNVKTGLFLDMGCEISEFGKDNFTMYSNKVTAEQLIYRYLLQNCMTAHGFFPYFGEWWHFGYGDKEWAFFYNQTHALYSQVKRSEIVLG